MKPDCPRFDECNASMCPLMPVEYLKKLRGFYLEEDEICTRRDQAKTTLVHNQRRLQKANASGLFTYAMILSLRSYRRGLKGLCFEDSYGEGLHRKAQKWISRRSDRHRAQAA